MVSDNVIVPRGRSPGLREVNRYDATEPGSGVFLQTSLAVNTVWRDWEETPTVFHPPQIHPVLYGYKQFRLGLDVWTAGGVRHRVSSSGRLAIDNRGTARPYLVEFWWSGAAGRRYRTTVDVDPNVRKIYVPELRKIADDGESLSYVTLDSVNTYLK